MVAVIQFILITMVYVVSFLSLALGTNDVVISTYLYIIYYVNHLSNFFIYLAVSKEFRNEVKNLVKGMKEKLQRKK